MLFKNSSKPSVHRQDRTIDRHEDAFQTEQKEIELDPEVVWKKNPNPWESWSDMKDVTYHGLIKHAEPSSERGPSHKRRGSSFRKELQWKLAAALLLFAAVWALFHYDTEWTRQGQAIVKEALTDEIDFAAAAAWYKDTFAGSPSFIPIFHNEPETAVDTQGSIKLQITAPLQDAVLIRTFAELLDGIQLAGASEAEVAAVETGRVLLVHDQGAEGSTIVIQHAGKRVSVYGNLGLTAVKENDWVAAGERIGQLMRSDDSETSLLFFALKENDHYIDPVGVIPID